MLNIYINNTNIVYVKHGVFNSNNEHFPQNTVLLVSRYPSVHFLWCEDIESKDQKFKCHTRGRVKLHEQ